VPLPMPWPPRGDQDRTMTTFSRDLDPVRAAGQRRLWQVTLTVAGLSGLLAVLVGLHTVRAVERGEYFAELGYFVAVGIGLCALVAAGLASLGEALRGRRSGWSVLVVALAVAVLPFVFLLV